MTGDQSGDCCPTCGHALPATGRCPACDAHEAGPDRSAPAFGALPPMRYPNSYVWLVLVSSLDLILTLLVLGGGGGWEVNPIAAAVIAETGYVGAIGFKFAIVVLVIVMCEVVGRQSERKGRAIALVAVVISALPVAYSFTLLLWAGFTGGSGGSGAR